MPAPDLATLDDLIARLEAATGADRELDHDICVGLFPELNSAFPHCIGEEPIFWHDPFHKQPVPKLTGSLDAVTSLAALTLPGWYVGVQPWFYSDGERVTFRAYVIRPRWADYTPWDDWFDQEHAEGKTPPLAICLAVLRALRQEATRHE